MFLSKNLYFYSKTRFRPRILFDVSKIDMTTIVLGSKIKMPIMIAPTAMQKMAHPEGIFFVLFFCFALGIDCVLCICVPLTVFVRIDGL